MSALDPLPIVFVSLISRAGYVRQHIDPHGRQVTKPNHGSRRTGWNHSMPWLQ
jgi:glucan phosphorylase